MKQYGINTEILDKLIKTIILPKETFLRDYEIRFDDNGKKIFIFTTFYADSKEFNKKMDEYDQKMIDRYGSWDEIPEEEYPYYEDYVRTEILYLNLHKILFKGMGLDKNKYRLVVELVE